MVVLPPLELVTEPLLTVGICGTSAMAIKATLPSVKFKVKFGPEARLSAFHVAVSTTAGTS